MRSVQALFTAFVLCLTAVHALAADLTEPQKTELRAKLGDARTWDPAKMKDATLKAYLPASSAFFVKSTDAEHADYPYVYMRDGKPLVSRPVDGFLNAGEKVKVGVAEINKDSVRLWIGRNSANENVNAKLFLMVPFATWEQLNSAVATILTIQ